MVDRPAPYTGREVAEMVEAAKQEERERCDEWAKTAIAGAVQRGKQAERDRILAAIERHELSTPGYFAQDDIENIVNDEPTWIERQAVVREETP